MSWLDHVPVSEGAFVFQGDLYCEDCGRDLSQKTIAAKNENDSNDFPQPYPDGGGEADSAQFCGRGRHCINALEIDGHKIGCPLRNPLTRDGVQAVWESVKRSLVSPRKFEQMMGRLLAHLWGDYLDMSLSRVILPGHLPNLEKLVGKKYVLHHVALADRDHLYLLGITAPGQEYHLLRVTANDEGKLASLDAVHVPAELLYAEGVQTGQRKVVELAGVEKLLRQAVEDGAWD